MNKQTFFKIIFLILIFGGLLFSAYSVEAISGVQFGDKDIYAYFNGLPFNLENWAPGAKTDTKIITIENNENFDIDISFRADEISNNSILAEVLTVNIGNQSKQLSSLFKNNIDLGEIKNGSSKNYNISISFDTDAGNSYQNKDINFNFMIIAAEKGTEKEEEVVIPGGRGGGGGGSAYRSPEEEEKIINIEGVSILEIISQETGEREEILGWNTTDENNEPLATNGAVVYGTQSVPENNLGPAPNYGYQFRQESEGKKENHTITLSNLQPGATYYYRIISWASPDTVSREYTFTVSEEGEEPAFTGETTAGEAVSGTGGGEEGTGTTTGTGVGEPEEIEDLISELTEEGDLPSGLPAGLLTAATLLTLGTGKNIIAMFILFILLIILFFLYDKYFRREKKNKVKGF